MTTWESASTIFKREVSLLKNEKRGKIHLLEKIISGISLCPFLGRCARNWVSEHALHPSKEESKFLPVPFFTHKVIFKKERDHKSELIMRRNQLITYRQSSHEPFYSRGVILRDPLTSIV